MAEAKKADKGAKDEEKNDRSSKLKASIQQQIEIAEENRQKELFRQRIGLARAGIHFYDEHNFQEAVKNFKTYLKILEDYYKVTEHGLSPNNFDRKKDVQELLLISGVYWDLVKLYDRTKSPSKHKEFRIYVNKYVEFSRGMPFQPLCAESVRKYLATNKALHRPEFNFMYGKLKAKGCFVATALSNELQPHTLPALREFRDRALLKFRAGVLFVNFYYEHGPRWAYWLETQGRWARPGIAWALDYVGAVLKWCRFSGR